MSVFKTPAGSSTRSSSSPSSVSSLQSTDTVVWRPSGVRITPRSAARAAIVNARTSSAASCCSTPCRRHERIRTPWRWSIVALLFDLAGVIRLYDDGREVLAGAATLHQPAVLETGHRDHHEH